MIRIGLSAGLNRTSRHENRKSIIIIIIVIIMIHYDYLYYGSIELVTRNKHSIKLDG